MFHKRVFIFDFQDDKLPKFDNEKEHQEFLAMIGRMVMYGCETQHPCDTVQFAHGFIDDTGQELVMSYRVIESQPEMGPDNYRKYSGSPLEKVGTFMGYIQRLIKPYITIGAVKHSDGKWGYHS